MSGGYQGKWGAHLFDCEDDSRASVGQASLELAVLVSDSLACGVLPILILRKLQVRDITQENVLSNQDLSHLLAFKPKCCGLDSPVMLFGLDLL